MDVHYSSKNYEWETPLELFQRYNDVHFPWNEGIVITTPGRLPGLEG